jgi:L-iditol 2-dehydrogenase
MLTAELTGVREFRITETELTPPAPGEVQVAVEATGICGSDLHNFNEGGIGDSPCRFPMVLGHEPAGVVVATGDGVTGIAPGDRYAFEPAIACHECPPCLAHRENLCDQMRFMSSGGVPGFFRERVNLPAANLVAIPAHVSTREATLIEPLAVALHSLALAHVQPGESAVVFGCGPIGLLTIAALKLAGALRVWAIEPVEHRREMARAMGADVVADAAIRVDRSVDLAFDCAAAPDTANQAIAALGKAGRLVYTGIPAGTNIPLYAPGMRRKEITFINVHRSNHQSEQARDILAEHLSRFAPLLTHARPLEKIQEAFTIASRYEDGVGKMLVVPH